MNSRGWYNLGTLPTFFLVWFTGLERIKMLVKLLCAVINILISISYITVANSAYGKQPLGSVRFASEVQSAKTSAIYLIRALRDPNKVPQLNGSRYNGGNPTPVPSTEGTSAPGWLCNALPRQAILDVVSVTDVKVNPTDKGIELILVTPNSQKLQVRGTTEGNSYIADIPNAKLQLVSGESFRQQKPAVGIAEVTVVSLDANTLRVTVTGETGAPTVELFDSTQQGLVFGVTAATRQSLQRGEPPQSAASSTAQQPTQTIPKPANSEEQKPIELEVIGTPEASYRVPRTSVGTKTPTDLRDIPGTVQVIPRAVIDDLGARNLSDVVQAYGLTPSFNSSKITDNFTIRGFLGFGNTLRNGLRDEANRSILGTDLSNVERVEILRGPASVLYGQLEAGGVVNIVTKQPLDTPYYALDFGVGSFNYYQPSIDFSGPLTSDKKLLYRLNADFENRDSFTDFSYSRRFQITPVITWRIGDNTTLTVEGEYYTRNTTLGYTLPAEGTILPNPNGNIPLSRFVGEPDDELAERTTYRIGYDFKHRFNDNWSLQNTLHTLFLRADQTAAFISALNPDKRIATRSVQYYRNNIWDNYIMDTNVVGKFNTGSISHQLLLGFDLYRNYIINDDTGNTFYSLAPLDLFNPVYGSDRGSLTSGNRTFNKNDAVGVYAQDQISLTDNLKLVLGGRFDYVDSKAISTNILTNLTTTTYQSDTAFTPRVGIVYQPIKPISLYASYSQSFTQNVGTDINGSAFKPSHGTQYEVGVKADLLSDKLSATLALFDLTKDNVLTPNLQNTRFNIQSGEQRGRGVEFTLTGEVLPGWNVIASYAYLDGRVTEDNRYPVGNRLQNAPEHTASLWTSYFVPKGSLKGWGVGLGLFYVSEKEGDLFNTFQLPSYFLTNAALYYRKDNLDLSLNFKNLFDVEYFESSRGILDNVPGDPFTVELRARWKF
ncbi:MAG: TonB-dependent siderophore receptor [Nostoc sp.]|uniref:TonB-dependent siderophore receptor n=1 Tax=Nostoc sp. TaxID=1180 RepID=UPI002FFAF387